jgi:hypothetical protein
MCRPGAIGHDVDFDFLVLAAVIFQHVGGVVEREIHHLRIVLVDLDGDAMRLGVGGEGVAKAIETSALVAK